MQRGVLLQGVVVAVVKVLEEVEEEVESTVTGYCMMTPRQEEGGEGRAARDKAEGFGRIGGGGGGG